MTRRDRGHYDRFSPDADQWRGPAIKTAVLLFLREVNCQPNYRLLIGFVCCNIVCVMEPRRPLRDLTEPRVILQLR